MSTAKSVRTEVQKMFEKAEWDTFLNEVPDLDSIEKNSNLCLFGDGQWLVRKNRLGTFCRKYRTEGIPGLDDGPEPFFNFALPKIPFSILKQQVSFYREVMRRHNGAEAYSIVMYDTEEDKYFLLIPKQRISGASVSYDQEELRKEYPSSRYIEVISAHSHNSMGAFFSGIDDNDEKGDLVYMVMGTLDRPIPTFKIRANVAGKQCCFLSLEELFDTSQAQWDMLSPGWIDQHDPAWMEMLNVSGNYHSPHQSGGRYAHTRHTASKTGRVTTYHGSTGRYSGYPGSYGSYHGGYHVGNQTSFDDYLNYWEQMESFAASYDEDTVKLMDIAKEFAEDSVARSPAFAIAALLDALVEKGYGQALYRAVEMSAASDILWILPTDDEDVFNTEELDERDQNLLLELSEEGEE